MISVDVEVVKEIPKKQIKRYEDRVVYNTAVYTREFTKNDSAFPYLTGTLMRAEIGASVTGKDLEYGLLAGVSYAKNVWLKKNVHWTNPATETQWYYTVYKKQGATIVQRAKITALKEI